MSNEKDRIRIEYLPLSEVAQWPRNPKGHALDTLGKSFERFGFVNPIILDERSKRLVAGHGRLEALQAAKAAGRKPPDRIAAQDGQWLVPVIRGIEFANEHEAEAYLVADNRLVELGSWSDRELAELLTEHGHSPTGLEGTGFSQDDLDELLKRIAPDAGSSNEDGDGSPQLGDLEYRVVAFCKNEESQASLIIELEKRGYKCQALIS